MAQSIVVWPVRGKKNVFFVKLIAVQGFGRQKPYRFYFRRKKIICSEKRYFGVLYGQICYLIRQAHKEQGQVSQIVKSSFSKNHQQYKKKKIPSDAYAHQYRCQEAGACEPL